MRVTFYGNFHSHHPVFLDASLRGMGAAYDYMGLTWIMRLCSWTVYVVRAYEIWTDYWKHKSITEFDNQVVVQEKSDTPHLPLVLSIYGSSQIFSVSILI